MTMASSPSSTVPPRTPIAKKPVPNTPQQSPMRLKTDNLSLSSSSRSSGSAGDRKVGDSLQQMSPEVSPVSSGSAASWRSGDISGTKEEENGVGLEGEEESFQAQVERELREREAQRRRMEAERGEVVVDRPWQSHVKTALEKQPQNEERPDQGQIMNEESRWEGREDDVQGRQSESGGAKRNATIGMDESDSDADLCGVGRSNGMGARIGCFKDSKGKGKEKARPPSVAELLPSEIIQMILCSADPNTFDTLTLISSKWYHASRSAFVFAHQLRQLGVPVHGDPTDDKLPELIERFNSEARRGLFEAYLKPKITEVQLICSSPSSAGALPGGDSFRFEFSAKGRYLLALSSSRIFVVCLAREEVSVKREFKILKRPVTAAILDDGLALAVLSSNHVVTLYDLSGQKAKIMKTLPLENPPRTIALSPGAAVLAAAYDGGIEVYSLHSSALSTDRRAVNCDPVDSLAFSSDGLVLLGTTLHTRAPTTVIISAPFFSIDFPEDEGLSQMWTTQVLFPRASRDNSHATLLPGSLYHDDDENIWAFTFDRHFETFRAVRVDDLRNGHTYFAGPSDGKSVGPTVLPSPSVDGEMVAVGFGGKRVWVYGVPGELDLEHKMSVAADGQRNSTGSVPSDAGAGAAGSGTMTGGGNSQQGVWAALSDRSRNVFVRGRQIGEIEGLAGLKFLRCGHGERLVAVASGGVGTFESGEGEDLIVDGGRVILFDFGKSPSYRGKTIITIEIGDGQQGHVETLTEEERDLETEVQMARRRTVTQRTRQNRQNALNQQNSDLPPVPSLPALRNQGSMTALTVRPVAPTRRPRHLTISRSPTDPTTSSPVESRGRQELPRRPLSSTFSPGDEDISTFEEAVDVPYSQGEPRSSSALRNRPGNTPGSFGAPRHQQALNNGGRVVGPDGRPIPPQQQLRIGRREEQWEEPPPAYTPRSDNDPPLPAHLLLTLQPRGTPLPVLPGGLPYLTGPVTVQHQQQVQQQLQVHQQLLPQIQQYHAQQHQQQIQQHQQHPRPSNQLQVQTQPPQALQQQQHRLPLQHQQHQQHQQPQQNQQPQQPQHLHQQLPPRQVQPQQVPPHQQPQSPRQIQRQRHQPHQPQQSQQPQQPQQLQQPQQPQQPQQAHQDQHQQHHQHLPSQPQQHPQASLQYQQQQPPLQPSQRAQQQSSSWGAAQGASMMGMMGRRLSTRSSPRLNQQQPQPLARMQTTGNAYQLHNTSMLNVSTLATSSVSAPVSPAVGSGEYGVERSYSAPLTPGGYGDFHARRPSSVSVSSFSTSQPTPQLLPQSHCQWQHPQQQQLPPQQHQQHRAQMTPVIPANIPLPGTPPMRPMQQRPETPTMGGGGRVSPMPSLDFQRTEYVPPPVNVITPGSPVVSPRSIPSQIPPIPPTPGQHQQNYQQYPPQSHYHRPSNIPASPAVPSPLRRSTNGSGGTLRMLSRSMSRSRLYRGRNTDSPAASSAAIAPTPAALGDPEIVMIRDPFQAHAIASSARGGVAIPVGIGVRRNPSRPERSAAKHVKDARRRKMEKEREKMERGSVAGSVTSRFRGKEGSCIVM